MQLSDFEFSLLARVHHASLITAFRGKVIKGEPNRIPTVACSRWRSRGIWITRASSGETGCPGNTSLGALSSVFSSLLSFVHCTVPIAPSIRNSLGSCSPRLIEREPRGLRNHRGGLTHLQTISRYSDSVTASQTRHTTFFRRSQESTRGVSARKRKWLK